MGFLMAKEDASYDAVVVGGGHNGLVAATYLAKAGKRVLLLEGSSELGGATTSVSPFPEFSARLSRYSYLVSLLPDQIVSDLGINFKTLERGISSYTPVSKSEENLGLLIANTWDSATEKSFELITGGAQEGLAWQKFYGEIAGFAQRIAPTMLEPLKTRSELQSHISLDHVWDYLIENPIGDVIQERFKNDTVRGVVLTDALIGTFVSAGDLQANRCFLYHLIGNGTGQWRVPQGGMGALVIELERVARSHGVDIQLHSRATEIESSSEGVRVKTESGSSYVAKDLLFAGAPQTLARLRGEIPPKSLDGAQLKINMLLEKLPRLKSGIDPKIAFAGTFHINESFRQLEDAFKSACNGEIPDDLPLEMYCHTLTDPTILSAELASQGFHTLTLFGLHTSASLFDSDHTRAKEDATRKALESLNKYLLDPIESVLARGSDGTLALEVKTPLDLQQEIGLPRGNIFHKDLDFPFLESREDNSVLWGAETSDPHIFLAGAGAQRGGGVSGIAGHNAAMACLNND